MKKQILLRTAYVALASALLSVSTPALTASASEMVITEETNVTAEAEDDAITVEEDETIIGVTAGVDEEHGDYTIHIENGKASIKKYNGTATELTVIDKITNAQGIDMVINTIDDYAFNDCTTLQTVILPESINTLGGSAFGNCTSLKKVVINGEIGAPGVNATDNRWNRDKETSPFYNAGNNVDGIEVVLGSNATRVPARLFATGRDKASGNYCHIKKLVLSDKIKSIDEYALYNCYDLNEIVYAENGNLTTIGNYAFKNCPALAALNFPNTITEIGDGAFANNITIKEIVFPESVIKVGNSAFSQNVAAESITVKGSITFGEGVFADCTALKNVDILASGTLGDACFRNCTSLSKVFINGDLADGANNSADGRWDRDKETAIFFNTGANGNLEVIFGEKVTVIPAYIFATGQEPNGSICHVKKVSVSNNAVTIKPYAFYNCYELKDITWGSKIATIGNDAFKNCHALSITTLPENLETVKPEAFMNCTGITEMTIPASVINVETRAFSACTELQKLTIEGKITAGAEAFSNCSGLKKIYINKGGNFGDLAFANATSLNEIEIKGDLGPAHSESADGRWDRYKGRSVFLSAGAKSTEGLTVRYATNVSSISDYIFATASDVSTGLYAHVTDLYLPASLDYIGVYCLYNCHDLKTINFEGTEARWKKLIAIEGKDETKVDYIDFSKVNLTFGNKPYGKEVEAGNFVFVKGQTGIKFTEAAKVKADGKAYKITVSKDPKTNKKAVSLSKTGKLKCIRAGEAVVTVRKADNIILTYNIKIIEPNKYKKTYKKYAGDEPFVLDFTIDETLVDVVYESNKPEVATVDEFGKVEPKAKGTVKITITVKTEGKDGNPNGSKKYTVKVKVKKAKA